MQQKSSRSNIILFAIVIATISLSFALLPETSVFSAETYPQIDITGYKKYEYSKLNVDTIQNLFSAQAMLGGNFMGGPWQERLRLRIVGKLTEKLSVSYDLEQQPDMPDKFDVKVGYDKTELTFGDFQANFTGNEFVSTSKYLNGVMVTSKDNWYDLTFVPSSKLKSETQQLVSQRGSNTKGPYNLGHGSIIEGSERVELNNILLTRGVDYTIDSYSGKITFSRILSPDDEFKYSYEFTNALDLFFPTVSKRDFVGVQSSIIIDPTLLGMPARKAEMAIKQQTELFPTMTEALHEKASKEVIFLPPQVAIEASTEPANMNTISINGVPVIILHNISGEAPTDAKAALIKERLETAIETGVTSAEISNSTINGEEVVTARGLTIATASKKEAQINAITARDLANKWKDNIIFALMTSGEAVSKLITPETEPFEYEWESTGTYKLKNFPMIPYSERITYMGTQLKKFEDYLINYQDGTITFLRPTLPTILEPLSVEYQYIDVAGESETLPGTGKGPYTLAHEGIIEGSEMIYVNNIPYVRELDYKIDYQNGKVLFFTNIPQTANIIVKYRYLVVTAPPAPITPAVPRSLKVGVSYLKESGKRGTTPPAVAVTETISGNDIINNSNLIYLNYRPVISTSEVELTRNNILMTYGVDYRFATVDASGGIVTREARLAYVCDPMDRSDGLKTGTILYIGGISATDEVSVSYSYSKWSQERYTDSGNGSILQYPISNFRNIVPGGEEVYIWRKSDLNAKLIKLVRSTSIESFSNGSQYKINYSDPPYITFIGDPVLTITNPQTGLPEPYYIKDINFTVIFKFVAQASVSERPISHDVVGFDSNFKVGDYLNLEGSFARSKTDQVFTSVSTNETRFGDGTSQTFNLNSPYQIIDGSEQVFLNGQKLNRDDQYSIFYESNSTGKYGMLTFFLVKPSTLDTISIDYNFADPTGPLTKLVEKQGSAYKFGGALKPFPNLELAADYKKIDASFSPMGGTSIPLGSEFKHGYTKFSPLASLLPGFWISGDIKESNVPINNYPDKFLHSYDKNMATGFNTFGLAQIDFGVRDYLTSDDLLPGSNTHNNDYRSSTYSLSIAPKSLQYGEFSITNRNDIRKTISSTDIDDKLQPRDTLTDYYHTSNSFDLTKRFKWTLDYQANLPSTISYEAGSRAPSRGKTVERSEINDLSSNLRGDLTFGPIKRLYTYWNKIGHNENNFIAGTLKSTLNETYHVDMVPIDQINSSVDYNRQETPTITTVFGNPKTERTSANIRVTPYSTTALGWSGSRDDSLQETGYKTSGAANAYTIDHTLLSEQYYQLTTRYNLSATLNKAPLLPDPVVVTDTRSFSQDYNLTITPISVLSLTSGFLQEDFSNKNDASVSPVDTRSQSQTTRVGSSYRASNDLDLSGNYSVKVTKVPALSAHRSIVDAHAIYRLFTYGTVNYDWSQEDNGGEIVGGLFTSQSFTRIMQALSVNFVVPQTEKMILSSIVFRAEVKWADFTDKFNPDNSFKATLLSFEGTFNF